MIDSEQIVDLRPGDIVTITDTRWGAGVKITGPLVKSEHGSLIVGSVKVAHPNDPYVAIPLVVKSSTGENSIHASARGLTVVSRGPRPFYVNVDRDPEPGDIFRSDDPADSDDNLTYSPSTFDGKTLDGFWDNIGGNNIDAAARPPLRRLLIDGTTGQVVT